MAVGVALAEALGDLLAAAAGVLGLPAGEEHREQGADQGQSEHSAEPDQPAPAHLPLPDEPLLLLTAMPFPGYACAGVRSYPPPVASSLACRNYRLPLVFTGGRPTNPMHTSDRDTRACSGLAAGISAIFAIVRESYLPDAWVGTLRYRFAAMRVPSVA